MLSCDSVPSGDSVSPGYSPESKHGLPIAVLISGGGTTLKNLIDRQKSGELSVDFRLVISSRKEAKGLLFADQAGIPKAVLRRKDFSDGESHSEKIFEAVRRSGARLVVMGGYLEHLLIPEDFTNRVINIHPSLIPAFCGQGMYGLHVHQAAIDFGVKITGCTVHFVDNQYDHGPILYQASCPVLQNDTAETLQQRVFELEREALPAVLQDLALKFLNSL
jgi:phosphoribosylglycinamide formyltransferase-1